MQAKGSTTVIPERLPANLGDNTNYIMEFLWRPQIHMALDFAKTPDRERLARAMRLVLDAEPVLGSAYVPRAIAPYWKRLSARDLDCTDLLTEIENEQAESAFLAQALDACRVPQIVGVLRPFKGGSRFVLKINHQVADAGGSKEIAYRIAAIYRALGQNRDYVPPVNRGSRSVMQVYRRYSPLSWLGMLWRYLSWEMPRNTVPLKSIGFSVDADASSDFRFDFQRFSAARLDAARRLARKHDATLNDLFVAASLRALAKHSHWSGAEDGVLRLISTIDLRRYLPQKTGAGICNLSSFFLPNLGGDLGDDFEQTLIAVKRDIDRIKARGIGLGFMLSSALTLAPYPFFLKKHVLHLLFMSLAKRGNIGPGMTNMGPIERAGLDFDDAEVAYAELIVPPVNPPFFATGLSGFDSAVTLSSGFRPGAIAPERLRAYLQTVEDEFPT